MSSLPPLLKATAQSWRVLCLSTIAFTLMFNVWLMLGVLGISIRKEFKLSDSQLEWLIATAILSGSLLRLNAGLWADRYGGKVVFIGLLLVAAIPTYLLGQATSYEELLLCALFFGLAGNAFSAGISWNSAWFPPGNKGVALGVFGAGNVGASGTKLLVVLIPSVLTLVPAAGLLGGVIPGGWRAIPTFYAFLLVTMAVAIWLWTPSADRKPSQGRPFRETLAPLSHMRVWRFGLYYLVVFGAYVALSAWLPKFYIDNYQLSLQMAALYTASYILPASLLRPVGGWLSDKFGPRIVTYSVFITMIVALSILSIPALSPALGGFVALLFLIGCCMGIGKASVYKYIPNYFPQDVGAAGGLVGMLGALGGFFLPPIFGFLGRSTGNPQAAFLSLLTLTSISLIWLHLVVQSLKANERKLGSALPVPAQI